MIRWLLSRVSVLVCSFALTSLVFAADAPAPAGQPVAGAEAATEQPANADGPKAAHGGADHAAQAPAEHSDAHGNDAHAHDQGGAAHDAVEHTEHSGGHGHEYSFWGDLSFWSFVAFIGFVLAIKKLGLWDLLLTSMSDREKAEWARLDEADKLLTQAEGTLRKFRGQFEALEETVRETMAEGHRDAEYTQQSIVDHARTEASAAVERATFEIERVKDQTLNTLFAEMADKVVAATEAALKSQLQSADQDRLIEATLGELTH